MTSGERAAVRFVRGFFSNRVLAEIGGFASPEYEEVLAACRLDLELPAADRLLAVKNLTEAFPQEDRHALTQLMMEALDAQFNRHRVRERAAFHVGVVVGRSQAAAARRQGGGPITDEKQPQGQDREPDPDDVARQLTVEQFFYTRPRSEMIFGHVRRSVLPPDGNDRIVSQLMSALLRYRRLDPDSQACAFPDVVLDSEAGLILQPAVAVVTFDRLKLVRDRIWGAPNVIAEVIDDRRARWTRAHRIKWYRNHGVQECWLLDPRVQRVDVIDFYRHPSEIPHVYGPGAEFVSRVLRGFRMPVSELYDSASDDRG